MPLYATACKLSTLATLAALLAIIFLIFACGGDETQEQTPAPAPIDMAAITTQIQQTICDELAMMPPPLSEAEIRSQIQQTIRDELAMTPPPLTEAGIRSQIQQTIRDELAMTPPPLSEAGIRSQIQQTIRDELAMMPPPLSEAEIQSLIEDAVSKSVPKVISYAEIQAMVDSAVATAYSGEEEGNVGEAAAETSTSRLEAVQQRGRVVCANNDSMAGFGFLDDAGNTVGFDVDLCRAVAAAVLGDANAVEFRPTAAAERGQSLQSGEIDMMSRNTTWTTSRDAIWGNFAQTMFYDGQGFIVPKSLGVSGVSDLEGASICVLRGTTIELNLLDFNAQNNMGFTIVPFDDSTSATEAYLQGQCDSLSTDQSGLVANAAGFSDPHAHVILPETISEEPLGTVVPHGDEQWYDIVKAVMSMLIYAEAFSIHSGNVPTAATGDTGIDRLFGFVGNYGQEAMGLKATAAQDVIRQVGNYGQIFDRHLTPLGLVREGSRNALWSAAPCSDCPKGGQIYAAPLR